MASSGTYDFSISNGEAVLAAYERIRVFPTSVVAKHMATARRELNFLFSEASNKQVNLWKVDLVTVDLVAGQETYDVQPRTVMILDAWITAGQSSAVSANDLYITPVSRTEYASFSNKATAGRPTCYWFDRLISPTITLWPVPDQNDTYTMSYYRCVQMEDANLSGGETPDVPYLWLDWLVAGLAHRLSRVYGPDSLQEALLLEKARKADADAAWTIAATQNVENVPLTLQPQISGYYRR